MLSDLPKVKDVQNVIQVHALRTLNRLRPESLRVLKIQQENTRLTTWHELKAFKDPMRIGVDHMKHHHRQK